MTRLLILGVGNTSRSDDALGPLLLRRAAELGRPDLVALEDYQLQIEHTLDLREADLALFIDAGTGTTAPFSFREIEPDHATSHTTHALAPQAVLSVYRQVTGMAPPPSFVLCVRGECFDLAERLSASACANLEAAWGLLKSLCAQPDVSRWRALAA